MSIARRLGHTAITLAATLALTGPGPDEPIAATIREARLREMPPERRQLLAERLKAFDALDPAERAAVRRLDEQLAAESEDDREKDLAALRRFHLWVQTLPESQRSKIREATPGDRMKVVEAIRSQKDAGARPRAGFEHSVHFGKLSPFSLAREIKFYLSLDPKEKEEVDRLADGERLRRLNDLGKKHHPGGIAQPSKAELDALFEEAVKSKKFPRLLEIINDAAKKKQARPQALEQAKQRLVNRYYFTEHTPAKVAPDRLLEFDRALPNWLRGGLVSFPPDDARRQLAVLYRLVYPAPAEFNVKPKAAGAAPAPKPAAPKKTDDAKGPAPAAY